ncbi:hypothetical protein [Chryseobacterium indologenes]|uniref:hypothetical protein n=1 Tax=Chryseobacterium indologenes TaxID=253 RepID=UPI0009A23B3B|nr:hypothetical protein [Chryseobacterium indologenes]
MDCLDSYGVADWITLKIVLKVKTGSRKLEAGGIKTTEISHSDLLSITHCSLLITYVSVGVGIQQKNLYRKDKGFLKIK